MANRIASASRSVSPSIWYHVPTNENPADCASRGLSAQELKEHDLWWGGPPWLHQEPIATHPQPQASELAKREGEEAKPLAVYFVTVNPISCWEQKAKKYSTLLHSTAYVFRFCRNMKAVLKGKQPAGSRTLSVEEVEAAELFLFQQSQARIWS